jgi:glutamate-ammonia-ligase adenylyltransferase
MRKMRERIDELADPSDIKRSRGGIRDIEFATQIWQLVHRVDDVETTLDTLRRLEAIRALSGATVATFAEHYTWLRKLEHRIQFESNRQTHCVPTAAESRRRLAVLMGVADAAAFEVELERRRETVRRLYADMVEAPGKSDRLAVLALVPEAAPWLDALPDPDASYAILRSNRDSLERIQTLVWSFPAAIPLLRASIPLTETVISGEVEEEWSGAAEFSGVRGATLRDRFGHAVIRHALDPGGDLAGDISDMADATLRAAAIHAEFSGWMIALGSLGRRDMGPQSDADIVLLTDGSQTEAEARASDMLKLISEWRREGMPLGTDVRLRPDGGKGLLVRSFRALSTYAQEGMEDWERFALGHARVILGTGQGEGTRLAEVLSCTLIESDRASRLADLLKMKRRIETERVAPHHLWRDVKLGHGSLSDIEWTVRLIELFGGAARLAEDSSELRARIRRLVERRRLTVMESEPLQSALGYLQEVRFSVWAAGFGSDVLPENPAKLGLLADRLGGKDGNDVLERHRQVAETVRRIYLDTVARLTEEVAA